ncbi:MAG: TerB family tellurite resistance protein [Bacteroidetes bacterium]|nr:TerB family tellurite resistance protein [Bacteroidota bacterium]
MSRPNKISTLDCLCYMYFCAMAHDGEIADSETAVMIKKVLEWVPDDQAAANSSIMTAADWWLGSHKQGGIDAVYSEFVFCVNVVKGKVGDNSRRAILKDLASIFEADGKVTKGEQSLYSLLEKEMLS